jgi:hypothetical protein
MAIKVNPSTTGSVAALLSYHGKAEPVYTKKMVQDAMKNLNEMLQTAQVRRNW